MAAMTCTDNVDEKDSKPPVWNKIVPSTEKASSGSVNGDAVVVMGDPIWPTLSECATGSSSPQVAGVSMPSTSIRQDSQPSHSNRESNQSNVGAQQPHLRNSFRRESGSHPRRDGPHYSRRNFNGRNAFEQPTGNGFARPPPQFNPFVYPPPMRPNLPFIMPPDYPWFYVPVMPFIAPPPFIPPSFSEIRKQIEYYFSIENLVKDTFLRKNMDARGWVKVDVISNFDMMKRLTNNKYHVLEAVRQSTVVEVQGNKIRRRNDWSRWILPPSIQLPTV